MIKFPFLFDDNNGVHHFKSQFKLSVEHILNYEIMSLSFKFPDNDVISKFEK